MAHHISEKIIQLIVLDHSSPLMSGNHPETLISCQPEDSPKFLVARLALLCFLREKFQNGDLELPPFVWNEHLKNGKDFRALGQGFASLTDHDFTLLGEAIIDPSKCLQGTLRQRLLELSEYADLDDTATQTS